MIPRFTFTYLVAPYQFRYGVLGLVEGECGGTRLEAGDTTQAVEAVDVDVVELDVPSGRREHERVEARHARHVDHPHRRVHGARRQHLATASAQVKSSSQVK